jgi:hypothetical protein
MMKRGSQGVLIIMRFVLTALVCVVLTACASTSAVEPQGRALNTGQARIYVIRPDALPGRVWNFTVSVDDKVVGKVAAGSYLSVDRPPGRHKLSVSPSFDFASAEHEFQAEAGRSYYFVANIKASTSAVVSGSFVMALPIPGTAVGKPLPQRNFMSGIYLGVLDAAEGRAAIAALGKP